MWEFLFRLLDDTDWIPLKDSGTWTSSHMWLHVAADIAASLACAVLTILLLFIISKKKNWPSLLLWSQTGLFLLVYMGLHLVELAIWWHPVYRLDGIIKAIAAILNWSIVIVLFVKLPRLLSTRDPQSLQNEIDERQKVEATIRDSERKFRAIFEESFQAMWLLQPDGSVLEANRTALKLWETSLERVLGISFLEAPWHGMKPSQKTALKGLLQRASQGEFVQEEIELSDDRHRASSYDFSIKPVLDDQGNVTLMIPEARDITFHKRAERKFRRLLESAPDAFVITDENALIVMVNVQAERMFGYRRKELIGSPLQMLIPDAGKPEAMEMNRSLEHWTTRLLDHSSSGLEFIARRKDERHFPIELTVSPLEVEEEMLVSFAIRDVTERKRAEKKFRELLESAPDAMVISDIDRNIVLINAQAEKLFGYSRNEMLSKPLDHLFSEGTFAASASEKMDTIIERSLSKALDSAIEVVARRKDGSEFPAEVSLSPLQTKEGPLVSAAFRDISERKAAEAALKRLNEHLEEEVAQQTRAVRQQKDLLQCILDSMADGLIVADEHGKILLWNPAASQILRCDCSPKSIFDWPCDTKRISIPDQNQQDQLPDSGHLAPEVVPLSEAIQGKSVDAIRLHLQHHSEELWLRANAQPLKNAEGTLQGGVMVFQDITLSMQIEEELRKSEERYRAVVEQQTELICRFRPDFTITFCNEALCHYFGLKREAIIGANLLAFLTPELADTFREYFSAFTPGNPIQRWEHPAGKPDGSMMWQHWTNQAFFSESGEILEYQGVGVDITARKEAEEKLKASETRFRNLFERIPISVWEEDWSEIEPWLEFLRKQGVVDLRHYLQQHPEEREIPLRSVRIRDVNDASVSLFQAQSQSHLRESYRELFQGKQFEHFLYKLIMVWEGKSRWEFECRSYTFLGKPLELLTRVYIPLNDGCLDLSNVIVAKADITERRALEMERMLAKQALDERRAIGEEIHDGLGQQLTGMAMMTKSLHRRLEAKESPEADTVAELTRLVQDTQSQAKRLVRGLSPVEIEDNGLMSALQELAKSIESQTEIQCEFKCPLPVLVDKLEVAKQLYLIAQESVNNAVKHAEATKIMIHLDENDQRLLLEISDNGVGLPPGIKLGQGLGLRTMPYRATVIGAELEIQSDESGTSIRCILKYDSLPAVNASTNEDFPE
ncbi:Hypothetical protein PBC10988_17010 [Planctomycetales bacterium 10988]|nr:Hypothetical protein PBC10988_17010 [Planctomycetales bacterium 10988]